MITAYATLKKAAANANHAGGRLDDLAHRLIVQVCDEILVGLHHDMFPLHVWMTGSGTQFNMTRRHFALGSKTPVPPTTMEQHRGIKGPASPARQRVVASRAMPAPLIRRHHA